MIGEASVKVGIRSDDGSVTRRNELKPASSTFGSEQIASR